MKFKSYLIIITGAITLVFCKPKKESEKQSDRIENKKDTLDVKPTINEHDIENQYLALKNKYLHYFENYDFDSKPVDSFFENNEHKLKILEKKLLEITKNHPLSQHFKNNQIILESLSSGFLGYDLLDGLKTQTDSVKVFITTKYLLKKYLENEQVEFKNRFNSLEQGKILSNLESGAAYLNMNTSKFEYNNIEIFTSLGVESQDPHPFQPKTIFATWEIEEFVYIMKPYFYEFKFNENSEIWETCKQHNESEAYVKYGEFYSKDPLNRIEIKKAHKLIKKRLNSFMSLN